MARTASDYHLDSIKFDELRNAKRISKAQIAKELYCSKRTIDRYTQKNNPYPIPEEQLKALAKLLGVEWTSLVYVPQMSKIEMEAIRLNNMHLRHEEIRQKDRADIQSILVRHGCISPFSSLDMNNGDVNDLYWHYVDSLTEALLSLNEQLVKASNLGHAYAYVHLNE